MNADRVNAVADAIEQHSIADLGFNMYNWRSDRDPDLSGHNCGTVACIAGWAAAVANGGNIPARIESIFDTASEYLGLNHGDADALFVPPRAFDNSITPQKAVAVLRHLASTGEVDWSVADAA